MSNFLENFEPQFESEILKSSVCDDPAHDFLHFKRVVALARHLAQVEKARMEIVIPAAWFHDYIIIPKNDLRRASASQLSAQQALIFLGSIGYPDSYLKDIFHAIEGHSFSANIETKTIEACVVQDADRLDAIGAIGIARCFTVAAQMKRSFYNIGDPFCDRREPDDMQYTLDHFYKKLFVVATSMKTKAGQIEASKRLEFMKSFISQLKNEI